MGSSWYYVENNERVGPVEEAEMVSLVKSGVLTSSSYVWKKGYENWTAVSKSEELLVHLSEEEIDDFQATRITT